MGSLVETEKNMMNECYKCKYRGDVPGSAHSSCNHPYIQQYAMKAFEALNIRANEHGVNSGWFIWPYNFDPTWLENCDGFKEKEKEKV